MAHVTEIVGGERGSLLLRVDGLHPEDPEGHLVIVPAGAVANRMELYGLETPEEGLEALVREHVVRLGGLEPEGDGPAHAAGGLHSQAKVTFAKGATLP